MTHKNLLFKNVKNFINKVIKNYNEINFDKNILIKISDTNPIENLLIKLQSPICGNTNGTKKIKEAGTKISVDLA